MDAANMNMIERVARAVASSANCDWHEIRPDAREFLESLARVAITAMRDPTDDMLVASELDVPILACFMPKETSPSFLAWQAAIDAALGWAPCILGWDC